MLSFLAPCLLSLPGLTFGEPAQGAETSMFGEPVVVYGRRISDDEIKRFMCFGIGGRDADMFKFATMTRQELDNRRRAGATEEELAKFDVGAEELERRLQREKEDFLLRYPTLDFPTEVARAELSVDLFRERLRQTLIFDKVFRPDNPDEWPEITKAIIAQELTPQWIEDERVSYRVRRERQLAENLPDLPADDPIAVETTRGTILTELNKWARVSIDPDEIATLLPELGADAPKDPARLAALRRERAEKVLFIVEDQPIFIAQVWERIAPYVTPDQIEDAKRFLTNCALLERWLTEKGTLMSPAQYREWFPSTARQGTYGYMEYLNQHEMLSSQILGFPSLWAFANYMRINESFRRSIAEEIAKDENLVPILPVINQVAGAAKLNVHVMLISAYDFDHVKWKDNGWADAKRRVLDIKKALDEGAEWQPMLELHSEFWDPPMPDVGAKPMQNFYFDGTFGNQPLTRNQMLSYLLESEYRMFMYGPSATDRIFFEQKMGTIGGPYRGPRGYFLARITGKTPPASSLDLRTPVHRQIAEMHYVKTALNARVLGMLKDGVAAGQVKGLALGGSSDDV